MAHRDKVVRSFDFDHGRCLDVYRRPDGVFGYREYRRDPEDGRGWFDAGGATAEGFETEAAALAAARSAVPWLEDVL